MFLKEAIEMLSEIFYKKKEQARRKSSERREVDLLSVGNQSFRKSRKEDPSWE